MPAWSEIEGRLEAAGVDMKRTADFSGVPVCDNITGEHLGNIPYARPYEGGGIYADLEPGTFATNGQYYRVTVDDGNGNLKTMLGHAGDKSSAVEEICTSMGLKHIGNVPFANGEITGRTDVRKLMQLYGVPNANPADYISHIHSATFNRDNTNLSFEQIKERLSPFIDLDAHRFVDVSGTPAIYSISGETKVIPTQSRARCTVTHHDVRSSKYIRVVDGDGRTFLGEGSTKLLDALKQMGFKDQGEAHLPFVSYDGYSAPREYTIPSHTAKINRLMGLPPEDISFVHPNHGVCRRVIEDLEKNSFVQAIGHAGDRDIKSWVGFVENAGSKIRIP